MPGVGGARPGAGRKKGVPNKATAEIRDLAKQYGPRALKELAALAGLIRNKPSAESEQARVAAIGMLLDRGYGKATQPIDGDGEGGVIKLHVTTAADDAKRKLAALVAARDGAGVAGEPHD